MYEAYTMKSENLCLNDPDGFNLDHHILEVKYKCLQNVKSYIKTTIMHERLWYSRSVSPAVRQIHRPALDKPLTLDHTYCQSGLMVLKSFDQ